MVMPQHDYIPPHLLKSGLAEMGNITHVMDTGIDSICIAHIESFERPEDCFTILYRDTADGIAQVVPEECKQCELLIDVILGMATHIVHDTEPRD
jgi:hypothetical protein